MHVEYLNTTKNCILQVDYKSKQDSISNLEEAKLELNKTDSQIFFSPSSHVDLP